MQEKLWESGFDFSVRQVEFVKYLTDGDKKFPLSQRLLTCGNEIGVNLRIAELFAAKERAVKPQQALACMAESEYLLKLTVKTGYLTEPQSKPLREGCFRLKELIADEEMIDTN